MVRISTFFALLALALLLAAAGTSCGGASGLAGQLDSTAGNDDGTADQGKGDNGGKDPSVKPLPSVFDEYAGTPTRGASDVTTIPGSDALDSFGGTVIETTMLLDSTGSAGNMAWALYQVSGLAGRVPSTLTIDLSLPTPDSQYSVGVSNFSDGVWDFLQSDLGDATFEYNLTAEQASLVSQLGNLYFVVVVSNGNSATVLQASVLSEAETPENETRPLRARRPSVSEGLPDRIEISWQAVDGASSYELWRRLDAEGDSSWEMITTQAELSYIDTAIQLSTEYQYKVRALNSVGAGGFSDKRSGFAGAPPAGHDEAEDEDNEVEGMVSAVTETSFSIGERSFTVDANTQFMSETNPAATFADVTVGTQVEVQADSDQLGGWIARLVQIETEGGDDNGGGGGDEISLEAVLQSISETSLQVNDTTYAITAQTEFRDLAGNAADWTIFGAGDTVAIRAISDGNGGFIATRVELETEAGDDQGQEQKFTGTIDSISESAVVVGGTSFALTADTALLDNAGNPVDLSFFSAGMTVSVEAIGSDADGWTATELKEDIPE